jgi:uncharacterized protein YdeI (YjbR/CyaY-like superfamily)
MPEITHPPRFFRSGDELRRWLGKNAARARELWVGFYNARSGRKGITYREALDQALCFGWIDGVRKSLDPERYAQRFTPRTARSYWSKVNIARMHELEAQGLVADPGRAAFARRDEAAAARYSFERENAELSPALEEAFRADARAWAFFQEQPPGYRRLATFFVMEARKEETRQRRLAQLVRLCAGGKRLPGLERPQAKKG